MTLLLDRKGDQITITEEVVRAAAGNGGSGKEVMTLLLDRRGDQITITEELMRAAAKYNDLRLLNRLLGRLENDSEPTRVKMRSAALHVALMKGNLDYFNMLLDQGVDINAQDTNGWTLLALAVGYEREDMIKLLCARGAVKGFEFQLPPTGWNKHEKSEILAVDGTEVVITGMNSSWPASVLSHS
ncbi:hypothetical protein GQ53DRAFT_46898 [Thozetella sp. PMI_491]|nr:hypothetical protein GQ53DRAFT_46898 [Thozetella sp. PMI_491]